MADHKPAVPNGEITEEQKKRAAYALNMCVVSVSQIIDYDDLYVLEQEYEGILNNLNLEEMPKDEALLHILTQLLDTISYFRIAEKEREVLEKEYQQKMKNAIWDAVPTVGLIAVGGGANPWNIALSLASQVGIGYMNYRRSKGKILMEKEQNEWRLQRTAMEQFHGLRRELFDTAWRLAERYQFPDAYRITERQITEYNRILLDEDKLRRYERLDYVRDKFEAYPPFWYHLGSAANAVAQDGSYSQELRERYKELASESFQRYLDQTEHNLLREDQLLASCALEYFEILFPQKHKSKKGREELEQLVDRALAAAGSQYDVLELCAMSYLQLGQREKGGRLLRALVNHDYNKIVNAQLLSSFYVSDYIQSGDQKVFMDYYTLSSRLGLNGGRFLFPMPQEGQDLKVVEETFLQAQRELLSQKAFWTMRALLEKYTRRCNRAIPPADLDSEHADAYYSDDLLPVRREDTLKLMRRNGNQWAAFVEHMRPYTETVFQVLNDLKATLATIPGVEEELLYERLAVQVQLHSEVFLKAMDPEHMSEDDMTALYDTVDFRTLAGGALTYAAVKLREYVESAKDMREIARAESKVQAICVREELPLPEVALSGYDQNTRDITNELYKIGLNLLGGSAGVAQRRVEKREEMLRRLKERREQLVIETNKKHKVEFSVAGDALFENYRDKNIDLVKRVQGELLAVIDNTETLGEDILFTTQGVVIHMEENLLSVTSAYTVPYERVRLGKESKLLVDKIPYYNRQIDGQGLYDLIRELAKICDAYRFPRLRVMAARDTRALTPIESWDDILQIYAESPAELAALPLPSAVSDEELESRMADEDAVAELSLELGRMVAEGKKAVHAAVAAASATGAIPLPFADAPVLMATQVSLMVKLSSIFELDIKKDGLKTLVTTILGVGGANVAGKTIATNLLRFVPVGGMLAVAVSASTAGGITLALGNAFIEVCKEIKLGNLSEEDLLSEKGKKLLIEAFRGQMAAKNGGPWDEKGAAEETFELPQGREKDLPAATQERLPAAEDQAASREEEDEAEETPELPQGDGAYDIRLTYVGDEKIKAIKAVREITGLGLAEAKALVERAAISPRVIRRGATTADYAEIKERLEEAGARVDAVPRQEK